ncbi:MAG: hypothetical protein E7001_03295 [Coriobacteriaceae bacterium]|nr:hypothetical protein [Coriobacteriaceae bacterium]
MTMDSEVFGIMAVAGYSLAAVCALATAVYGATHRIREVRDELTGAAARRTIEGLRSGRDLVSASGWGSLEGRRGPAAEDGPMRLRRGERDEPAPSPSLVGDAPSEGFTSLMPSEGEPSASEMGTSLLGGVASVFSEEGTSLLSGGEAAEAPASESLTTLLGGGGAPRSATDARPESGTGLLEREEDRS